MAMSADADNGFVELMRFQQHKPPAGDGAGWYSLKSPGSYWFQLRAIPGTHPPEVALVVKERSTDATVNDLRKLMGLDHDE